MRSALRRLLNSSGPPVALSASSRPMANSFNLGAGKQSRESMLRAYNMSGTVHSIVALLSESVASCTWNLYKKAPSDGRRRYSKGSDQGSDQRVQVVSHAALKLWGNPNQFHSGFEFREGSAQHLELTGETFWVLNREGTTFPTSMWYVRPDRMEPVTDPDRFQLGWVYTSPDGVSVPLRLDEVILEKRPDPLDPFRGSGPVSSVMSNIQQQKYATDYQRNLFYNGADPGGVISFPAGVKMTDRDFDEFVTRWRESHRGISRAGAVGILESGATWAGGPTNKDMDYANLRLNNRDELREAWRIHKAMMGTSDDVNRANAQTAQEVFTGWQVIPRLERRKDTLNTKFLPMFGAGQEDVYEFGYDDPTPPDAENANLELLSKANAAKALVDSGFDPDDVLEAVGLPSMAFTRPTAPAQVPPTPDAAMDSKPDVTEEVDGSPQDHVYLLRRLLNYGHVPVERLNIP